MPPEGVQCKSRSDLLTLEELYYVIHLFVEKGVKKIRLTGGEPLIRGNILGLVKSVGKIKKVEDFAMTTNAYLLGQMAKDLKKAGLDRVNISLDSLDPVKFRKLTRGGELEKVLTGINKAINVGLGVKINTVLLKGINDDEVKDLMNLTKEYPLDVRFIEAMPIGPTKAFTEKHFLSCDYVLEQGNLKAVESEDAASTARLYRLPGAKGNVGLIRPLSDHFCHACNRLRLTSEGHIKPCLLSDDVIPLRETLRAGEDIRPLIDKAVTVKPEQHRVLDGESTDTVMSSIGG